MAELSCEIPQSVLDALNEQRTNTGDTTDHIVTHALADALQVDHATLFQVSSAGALVEGVAQGAITVAELARHGDFGLGTFVDFDGEMVVVDGVVYQVTHDGVVVPPDDLLVPFAVVTHFTPETTSTVEPVESLADLLTGLNEMRDTDNEFFAVRIEGTFDSVKTRVACKTDGRQSLVDVASNQAEYSFGPVDGVIVGFWSPEWVKSLNVAGWHLHFLTADRSGGGHVLGCAAPSLVAEIQHISDFRMAIPETAAFLAADLTRDTSSELAEAERDHQPV